ncbi:MAG: hypothetical protein H7Z11_12735 [Verrucomicrobia bacterium]|nr:hypothetical protein [Leptolyngbya sp. ES-bin-22]
MTTVAYQKSLVSLQRHLVDYRPYLERAIAAVKILETTDPASEEFSDALAELHVSATVLEPYSEGMVEAIDQYTEDLPDDDSDL